MEMHLSESGNLEKKRGLLENQALRIINRTFRVIVKEFHAQFYF
jgi:hypothetical protein